MVTEFTEKTLEDIKLRVDLGDLISSYGIEVKHAGASMKACCPFHHEKTPSFNINPSKGFYHCFGCGESGDAIKFVQKMEGLSFPEAVKKLAAQCGIEIVEKEDPEAGRRKRLYALMAEAAQFYHRCLLQTKEAEPAREYLAKRDLGEEVQKDFLIGYAPNSAATMFKWAQKHGFTDEELEAAGIVKLPNRPGDTGYHRFSGRLMFTIKDRQGRVVAFSGRQLVERKNSGKYVNSPETLIFKKSNVLFGFDRAQGNIARAKNREVICCEGQIDTIRLHINGFTTAVASQGTAFTEEHARMIKRVADAAILMYDDDGAGHKATVKVAGMLLAMEMPVRVVSLPDGDDPDSYLRRHSAAELQAIIDRAESIVSFQCRVEQAKEANPKAIDAVARIVKAVLSTVAKCPSPVLRASMVGEAAKLLSLPPAALAEELEKIKVEPLKAQPAAAAAEAAFDDVGTTEPEDVDFIEGEGEDAHKARPPGEREFAFMQFLMENEYDKNLLDMAGEFLPDQLFEHPFTVGFVGNWRTQVTSGEETLSVYADSLGDVERGWFDKVLEDAGKAQASGLTTAEIMQNFVRSLWSDYLKRVRGSLPIDGGAETDVKRLKLSMDIKRICNVKWNTVKMMVRDLMKGEY